MMMLFSPVQVIYLAHPMWNLELVILIQDPMNSTYMILCDSLVH